MKYEIGKTGKHQFEKLRTEIEKISCTSRFFLLGMVFIGIIPVWAQPEVRVDSLFAPSIGITKKYSILLPKDYTPAARYPVLFLLHGYSGGHTDWTSRTNLAGYVVNDSLIVVMPDAENSWYVNSRSDPRRRFEDYIVNDLRSHIAGRYSIDSTRIAIAGLSMGGYGALVLALRHPTVFRFVGSLSGALSLPRDLEAWEKAPWGRNLAPSLRSAFGTYDETLDLCALVRKQQNARLPYLYLVIGTSDGFPTFLPANRTLTDSLRAYKIVYEYHETPGGHNWKFWDTEIQLLLKKLRQVMSF